MFSFSRLIVVLLIVRKTTSPETCREIRQHRILPCTHRAIPFARLTRMEKNIPGSVMKVDRRRRQIWHKARSMFMKNEKEEIKVPAERKRERERGRQNLPVEYTCTFFRRESWIVVLGNNYATIFLWRTWQTWLSSAENDVKPGSKFRSRVNFLFFPLFKLSYSNGSLYLGVVLPSFNPLLNSEKLAPRAQDGPRETPAPVPLK